MPQIFLLSLVMAAVVMFAAWLLARDPAGVGFTHWARLSLARRP
ncbi:MAG: hypothetical protein VB138_03100 [Burkholderia sp.]